MILHINYKKINEISQQSKSSIKILQDYNEQR